MPFNGDPRVYTSSAVIFFAVTQVVNVVPYAAKCVPDVGVSLVAVMVASWYAWLVGDQLGQVAAEEIAHQRPLLFADGSAIKAEISGAGTVEEIDIDVDRSDERDAAYHARARSSSPPEHRRHALSSDARSGRHALPTDPGHDADARRDVVDVELARRLGVVPEPAAR